MMKYMVPLAVAVAIAFGWATRWDITPIPNGDGPGRAYLLNRWTGAIYILNGADQYEVSKEK